MGAFTGRGNRTVDRIGVISGPKLEIGEEEHNRKDVSRPPHLKRGHQAMFHILSLVQNISLKMVWLFFSV